MPTDQEYADFFNGMSEVYSSSGLRDYFVANPISQDTDEQNDFMVLMDDLFTTRSTQGWTDSQFSLAFKKCFTILRVNGHRYAKVDLYRIFKWYALTWRKWTSTHVFMSQINTLRKMGLWSSLKFSAGLPLFFL